MKPSIIKVRRRVPKQKSSSMSFPTSRKQVRLQETLQKGPPRGTNLEKRLTEMMFVGNQRRKSTFPKKSQGMSDFLKKVTIAKRKRHQSLHKKNVHSRKYPQGSITYLDKAYKQTRKENRRNRTKSSLFNVYSLHGKDQNGQLNRPRNENLERLFKRYKVSQKDRKHLIYNSNQVDKNIDALIQFVDNKFQKADEFIKKHILKSMVYCNLQKTARPSSPKTRTKPIPKRKTSRICPKSTLCGRE
jgi:hypothetical protein